MKTTCLLWGALSIFLSGMAILEQTRAADPASSNEQAKQKLIQFLEGLEKTESLCLEADVSGQPPRYDPQHIFPIEATKDGKWQQQVLSFYRCIEGRFEIWRSPERDLVIASASMNPGVEIHYEEGNGRFPAVCALSDHKPVDVGVLVQEFPVLADWSKLKRYVKVEGALVEPIQNGKSTIYKLPLCKPLLHELDMASRESRVSEILERQRLYSSVIKKSNVDKFYKQDPKIQVLRLDARIAFGEQGEVKTIEYHVVHSNPNADEVEDLPREVETIYTFYFTGARKQPSRRVRDFAETMRQEIEKSEKSEK